MHEFIRNRLSLQKLQQLYAKAAGDFVEGLRLNPGNPGACNNLAWFRATCPADAFRNGAEAVQLATQACEFTGFQQPNGLDTLAAAYAEAGNFELAVENERKALAMQNVSEKKVVRMKERLALYEQRKPFRQLAGQ